jgi:molybdenum cofactor cytidylyltransferase
MSEIAAVILAAGLSRRMGQPKMALPWGDTTVIGQVVRVLAEVGARPLVVVSGGAAELVVAALVAALGKTGAATRASMRAATRAAPTTTTVFNPDFANGEMLASLQVGIRALPDSVEACLVALGDQPQIEVGVVKTILETYLQTGGTLWAPSFHMRRGHPWLIQRALWPDLLSMTSPATVRDFLNRHAAAIQYVAVDRDSILQDLDTPEDYDQWTGKQKPGCDAGD